MSDLKDKVAVVTGASKGIGAAIAKSFKSNGHQDVAATRKMTADLKNSLLFPRSQVIGDN